MAKRNGSGFGDDNGKRLSPESSSTRLYDEDYVEIKNLCIGGRKESEVIRELVRRALYARRYRQATKDPAFKELLSTFDNQIGLRIHLLEERLTHRLETDFQTIMGLIGYLYVSENFALGEMKRQSLHLTPESVTEEEFLAEWQKRMEAMKTSAWGYVRQVMEGRNKKLGDGRQAAGTDDQDTP